MSLEQKRKVIFINKVEKGILIILSNRDALFGQHND